MQHIFEILLYQPLFNAFVGLYNSIPDVGFVIIIITILIKIVLYPLTASSLKAQQSLSELQPKLEEIKKTHKGDQQKIAEETMKLYKESNVNPFGSCLPLLLQIPIFLAMYWVFQAGLTTTDFHLLYPFVSSPGSINTFAFGIIDLKEMSVILAALAGGAQFWQAKLLYHNRPPKTPGNESKDETMMAMMNKQMLYVMPVVTFVVGLSLPAGLSLYWFLSTLITGAQQVYLAKKKKQTPSLIK